MAPIEKKAEKIKIPVGSNLFFPVISRSMERKKYGRHSLNVLSCFLKMGEATTCCYS